MPEETGPDYELGLDVKVWEEGGLWHAANMNGDDLVLILTAKTQDAIHAEIRKVAQEVFDLIWEERPADEKIEDYAARLGVTCKDIPSDDTERYSIVGLSQRVPVPA